MISPSVRPYRLDETDRSALSGGPDLKNQKCDFSDFLRFLGFGVFVPSWDEHFTKKCTFYMIFLIFVKTKKTRDVRTSNLPAVSQRDLLPEVDW